MGHKGVDESGKPDQAFVHDDPVVDEALDWFARLRGARTDRESQETLRAFAQWLERDPRNRDEFDTLEKIWGSASFLEAVKGLPVRSGRRRAAPARRYLRGAAAATAALLLVGLWQYPALMIAWNADYSTAAGDQTTVQLPDGSTMMLNTASAVSVDFDNGRRAVTLLQGEAFFDVRRDPSRPFLVTAQYGEVAVTGTAFSVRTAESQDEVFLERGKVEVHCLCDRAEGTELNPGEGVSITASAVSSVRARDGGAALAWREGRIMFDSAHFGVVLDELRRYYPRRIVVMNSRVNRLVVTGNYRLDNIEGAVRTLADAAGVKMTRIPGGLIILR